MTGRLFYAGIIQDYIYSRASDNGPSEKRTASLQRTTVVLRIVSSITLMLT